MIDTSQLHAIRSSMEYNDHTTVLRECHNIKVDVSVALDAISNIHPGIQSSDKRAGEDAVKAFNEENHSVVMPNWALTDKDSDSFKLTEIVRDVFTSNNEQPIVGSHLYVSREGGTGFAPHFDNCTNLIFQLDGVSKVTVYSNRAAQFIHTSELALHDEHFNTKRDFDLSQNILIETELHPGDCVYIPYKQFHCVESITDRISLSIPFAPTDLVLGHRLEIK
jgi:ribosomal protein L16 Arg81 hydroxylase